MTTEPALRQLIAAEGYLCDAAPLTCPRHLTRSQRCEPQPVPGEQLDVVIASQIARQIAGPDRRVNAGLLRQVLEFIEANPHRWNQHYYIGEHGGSVCGCVAGWALVFAGEPRIPRALFAAMAPDEIYRRARAALGLADWQAGALFGFLSVRVGSGDGGEVLRHPTFSELCQRVFDITGVRYTPREQESAA